MAHPEGAPALVNIDLNLLLVMGQRALSVAFLRYLLMAAPAYLIGYVLLADRLASRRIQARPVTWMQIGRETGLSLSSSAVFAAIDVAVLLLSLVGVMRLRVYEPAPALPAFAAYVALLLVIHDAYFYWAHRFLHWGPAYRFAHEMHHRSVNPTPFAAFAFHPVEAAVQYGFVPLVALVLPIPVMPVFVFGLLMTAMNVYGHSGLELLPNTFLRLPFARFLLTATHHDLHHSSVHYNFGFYTNVWDRWMRTNHPGYEQEFVRAASPRPLAPGASNETDTEARRPGAA